MVEGGRRLIAGNWKMHGTATALSEARAVAAAVARRQADGAEPPPRVAICPPATLVHRLAEALAGTGVLVGGQDAHAEPQGACTGDVSAEMLRDAGASLVILGHSERRASYRESDPAVAAKVEGALRAELEPIVCVGETLDEREDGQALAVVGRQLATSLPDALNGRAFALAYEPVWAIGTGRTPTSEQIAEVHAAIRTALTGRFGAHGQTIPILYGGSVKAANAREILALPDVDGALVGGASLRATDFLPIVEAGWA
ncbi:MAG: triose-phosphate isomerase [Proteobacteria bacterium]|nr:triose-phosphate isomerase [Pseudomonadota bacterium]